MNTFKYYVRIYTMIISQYIKARMQYRTDFIIGFIGMIFFNITGFLALWVIFQSIPLLAGWNFYELVFMYGYVLAVTIPLQLFFDNIWNLRNHLVDGSFIKYYFKPLDTMFYYMSEIFDLKGLGQLILSIIILIYASNNLSITWDFPRVLLFIVLFFSSSIVIISLMLIAASIGFFNIFTTSLMQAIYNLRDFARYPITIFNKLFRYIFTFVLPIGLISYYPLQIFFRPQEVPIVLFFSPLIGFGLFFLARIIWKQGVNTYSGTGS